MNKTVNAFSIFQFHPVPNDMEMNKWENDNEIWDCVVLMTDEFKNTETAATSTTEFPNPRDPLCLVVLIFACKCFFAPAGNAGLWALCLKQNVSVMH